MNILEIIVIVLAAGLAVIGYYRGFVRKVVAMLSFVLSIVMVSALLPYMTDFLKNSTPLYSFIVEQCRQAVTEQMVNSLASDGDESPLAGDTDTDLSSYLGDYASYMESYSSDTDLTQLLDSLSLTRIQQTELIEKLPVPDLLKDMLLDYNNAEGYRELAVTSFTGYIVNFIATMILNIISFLAAVILVQLLLRIAIMAMNILTHIPMFAGLNHFLGMLLGILQALFYLWIFFLLLSLAAGTQTGLWLLSMVQESRFLSYLYNSNLFMQVVLRTVVFFL